MSDYIRLTPNDAFTLPDGWGSIDVQGGGTARSGEIWKCMHGEILLHIVGHGKPNYFMMLSPLATSSLVKGAMYETNSFTLRRDLGTIGAYGQLAANLKATQSVIKEWHDFMIAAASCVGGPVGWAARAVPLMNFASQHARNVPIYWEILKAIAAFRNELVSMTPTLFWYVIYPVTIEISKNLPEAGVKVIANALAGSLPPGPAGKALGKAIATTLATEGGKRTLELMRKLLLAVIKEVLKKIAVHVATTAAKLTAEQVFQLAKHVVKHAETYGIALTGEKGERIVREIESHAQPILIILEKLEKVVSTEPKV